MIDSRRKLRVLVANERDERLDKVAELVEGLGHEIVARSVEIGNVGPLSRETGAEVALVGLGLDGNHALELISSIVHEAACPVIALLDDEDPSYATKPPNVVCLRTSLWMALTRICSPRSRSRCGGSRSNQDTAVVAATRVSRPLG
jgi:hypothetical protein